MLVNDIKEFYTIILVEMLSSHIIMYILLQF